MTSSTGAASSTRRCSSEIAATANTCAAGSFAPPSTRRYARGRASHNSRNITYRAPAGEHRVDVPQHRTLQDAFVVPPHVGPVERERLQQRLNGRARTRRGKLVERVERQPLVLGVEPLDRGEQVRRIQRRLNDRRQL